MNFGRITSDHESMAILQSAHDMGIRAINTADTDYSGRSESIVGRHISELPESERPWIMVELSGRDMGVPDDPNLTPAYLEQACLRSLDRLQLPSVDRVVLPRPSRRTPIEETLVGVQERILDAGLALSAGVSSFPAWLTCHAQHICRREGLAPLASELLPYNVLDRRAENELIPNAKQWEMETFAWGVLGQGLLAGRYPLRQPDPADSRAARLGGIYADRVTELSKASAQQFSMLADQRGFDSAELAIRWLLHNPNIFGVVVGPRSEDHLLPLAKVLQTPVELDDRLLADIDEINPAGTACADFFNSVPWMLQRV